MFTYISLQSQDRSDGVEVGGLSSIELSGLGRLVARETRLRLGRGKDRSGRPQIMGAPHPEPKHGLIHSDAVCSHHLLGCENQP